MGNYHLYRGVLTFVFFSVLTRTQRNELLELIMPKLKKHQEHNYNCDPNDTQLFTSEELAHKIKISEKNYRP